MRILTRLRSARPKVTAALGTTVLAAAAATAFAGTADAATAHGQPYGGADHALFVQTDNTAGNQVVAYHRAGNGTLTLAGSYRTGGLGGVLSGSVVDHLASQGSLSYDQRHGLLYAVNAGSNSVSVFSADGDRLFLRQVIGSGGTFPVSVATHGDLVYVLNATGGGSVQGYRVIFGRLFRIPGSNRSLGLDPTATPQFTNTPGQLAFSPGGTELIVTTKANGNDIDVFGVHSGGRLSMSPVVNPEPGTVPFAIAYVQAGHLVIANAGSNALFASNDGSGTISAYESSFSSQLTLEGQHATDPGTVDATASPDGQFLYVQTGGTGTVDEFSVGAGGSLTSVT